MEDYWEDVQVSSCSLVPPTTPSSSVVKTLESEFDCHHHMLIQQSSHNDGGGWKAELHQYLSDLPVDVLKETDTIEWWAVHEKTYLTLVHITKDVCAIPATSVPCERLFSACIGLRRHK
jgi:hypothetical protein